MLNRLSGEPVRFRAYAWRYGYGLLRQIFVFILVLPTLALAGNFEGYRATTLDKVIEEWNGITKDEGPGISFSTPQKIKFTATLRDMPKSCSNAALQSVLTMMNLGFVLKQASITHCVVLTSSGGRNVAAYVQDVLVPGLQADAKVGRPVEIYADLMGYQVDADRSRNAPIMFVSRFEPQ